MWCKLEVVISHARHQTILPCSDQTQPNEQSYQGEIEEIATKNTKAKHSELSIFKPLFSVGNSGCAYAIVGKFHDFVSVVARYVVRGVLGLPIFTGAQRSALRYSVTRR
jgi:hypothetical protein